MTETELRKLKPVDLDIEKRLADHAFAIEWAKAQDEEITALRAKVKAQDEMRENQIAYSCDLQRIIEDLCADRDIRQPETSARFHYDMAVKFRRAAQEAGHE